MPPLTTATGREFATPDECLHFIRGCADKSLDPDASYVESSQATIDMVYAFKALDESLRYGGELPQGWQHGRSVGS